MPGYRVTGDSRIVVRARSSIHDTTTTWSKVEGDIDADPQTLEQAGARADFRVDMTAFDAGDWLKNRKLRKDFELEKHPVATFELVELRDIVRTGDALTATAAGILRWRGREVQLLVSGKGTMTERDIDVTGTFELDIRDLGLKPPKMFIFKVESEVSIEVSLRARAV